MLLQLSIHHLALIDDMTIDFEPGMNVMTGETGAGKSIVVDAVNLVLGERADRDLITSGEMKARVEAVFDIADNEKVKSVLSELTLTGDEDTASISRELTSAGRNICRINGNDHTDTHVISIVHCMANMSISSCWTAKTISVIWMNMRRTRFIRCLSKMRRPMLRGGRRRRSFPNCEKALQSGNSVLICCASS